MKIRIGNDFKTKWAITWLGEPEDFSDATDMSLFFNIYDKKIELTKDVDYTITDNVIEIDVTPDICNILGVYNLELHYTKPNDDFIDGERRSAVDIDAFRIVGKSDKADATQDVSIISDAVAIFLDIAYKKLEEIEANEDIRITNEGERKDAEDIRVANENIRISNEQDRQTNTATAISNAEQATLNANNSAVYANEQGAYANEQGAYAEEMSSHPPTIINDYWHIWNFTTNQYESTGQYARGDSAVEGALVVQEKGQSVVNTMSQKAVTDEIVQLESEVDFLNTELTKASPNISDNIFTNSNVRADGTYAPNSNNWILLMYQPVPANQIIRIKGIGTLGSTVVRLAFRSSSGTFISSKTNTELGSKTNFTIQTPADIDGQNYVQIAVTIDAGANVGVDLENSPYKDSVMISIGEEDYPFSKKGAILTEKLEELLYGNTEDIKYNKFESAYISTTGDDVDGDGSFSKPLKTISKAKTLLFNKFILLDGIYESNDLDMSTGGEMTALNKGKAIVRGSERITINAVTLDSGDVYKADMGIPSLHINNKGVWVHNIPDSTTMIEASKRLPNFGADNHRLKSTRIVRVYSMDDLLTHNGNACYTENSTIYVRGAVVSSISSTNPIIISGGRLKLPISGNSPKTTVKGIAMEYMGVFILSEAEFVDCSLFYAAYSGFTVEDATATIKNCRIGGVDNNGIGYGGSTSNSKGIEVNNLIHDAKDQGSSAHGRAEVYRENCLFVHCNEGVADVGRAKSHFVGCHFLYNSLFDIRFTFSGSPNDGSALIVNCSGNAPNGVASGTDNNLVVMNSKFTGTMSPKAIVI